MNDLKSSDIFREIFLACIWTHKPDSEKYNNYSIVMQRLHKAVKEKSDSGETEQTEFLIHFTGLVSIMMTSASIIGPFNPYPADFQEDRRSAISVDFAVEELSSFLTYLMRFMSPGSRRVCYK